jgi:hypothetical protein
MTHNFTDALVMAIWRGNKPDALLHYSDDGNPAGMEKIAADESNGRKVSQYLAAHALLEQPLTSAYRKISRRLTANVLDALL